MHPNRQIYTGEKVDIGGQLSRLTGHSRDMVLPFIVAILFACAGVVLTIIGPNQLSKITQYIIDGITTGINMEAIARTALFLLGLYVLSAIFSFLQHFILATVTLRLSNRLRADIFDKVNRAPMKLFGRIPYGDILSRMTNDVNTLVQSLSNSLPSMVSAAAQFIGCLVMMFITEWHMSIAAVGATLLGFGLMGLIMSRSQKYFLARQTSLGQLNGYVEEMYSGHDVVRISRAEKKMKSAFDRLNKEVYQANRKSQFISGIMQPLMGFVGNLGYVAVCIYGSKLAMDGVIDFGVIVAFIMYVRLFTSPLSTFAQGMTQMQSAAAAGKRVFDFLEEEELEDESGKESYTAQVKGQVEFKNLRFGYSEDRKNAVIKDFSASVKPGQKIAIVGPTGAGKTTIVNLLMRFYELWGGSILIDGVPTTEMKREDVHSLFSMVLQDTWMFQGTVRENLVFNCQQVPDEEIEKACRACGIWDFVESLPEGLDTVLTENTSISAGQKQLFTIARAMIQNRPMLILDEATSSVDTRTELMTQKAMDELMKDRTSFVIAHRLSTIKNADLILVLKDGNIIEQGDHDTLLRQGGFYAELYNSQFDKTA
ncbi:MAG: ABC transporter ATP-binding protein [Candidatus Limivicinus sp.]|nr:ABC transporter ATP-binding protein/permease [Clostridiales bacterium]MDY6132995.1 ABC transporter ATP-binding protein [Candidatus Limivicinus sp.]